MEDIANEIQERLDNLKKFILELSTWKILLFSGIFIFILNVLISLLRIDPAPDFFIFFTFDGTALLSGLIPYVHYTPWYPILADLYMALFALFGMNVIIARVIQSLVIFGCVLVINDIITKLNVENTNWHLIWLIASPIVILYGIIALNFDIFMVFFLLLALDFFLRENATLVGVFTGLGIMVKLFPIVLLVPLGIYYIRHKQYKNLFLSFASAIGIYFVFYLPISISRVILLNLPIYYFIINYIIFFISPLTLPEGHPLNLPYIFFFAVLSKSSLKMIANIVAVLAITIFSVLMFRQESGPEKAIQDVFIPALFIFFILQPYIAPWYMVWVLVPRYIRSSERPFLDNYLFQPLLMFNLIVATQIHYIFNTFVIGDLYFASYYTFTITPDLFYPLFILILSVALKQVTAIFIYLKESPIRRYIVLPCIIAILIPAFIGDNLLMLLYNPLI
ncbi:MAG: glycosyltransferase 87 family protein [Candidatus Helarchaeota archaeon]